MVVRSCYQADVELVGFRFQREAFHMSSPTDELLYNETVCLWMTIYIYIGKLKAVIANHSRESEIHAIWVMFRLLVWLKT